MDLTGKNVIVTGGKVGIGRPTALELARRGASVTILGRNEMTCKEAVSQICSETGNDKVDIRLETFQGLKNWEMIYTVGVIAVQVTEFIFINGDIQNL